MYILFETIFVYVDTKYLFVVAKLRGAFFILCT